MPLRLRAFTLIETMVVIALVGILFKVALSSYQSYTLKSRRYAAQSCMMEYSQSLASYYSTNTVNPMAYTGATLSNTACATNLQSTYTFTLPTAVNQTFTLQATAKGTQSSDSNCASMTLQQDGTKTPATGCWP